MKIYCLSLEVNNKMNILINYSQLISSKITVLYFVRKMTEVEVVLLGSDSGLLMSLQYFRRFRVFVISKSLTYFVLKFWC